MNILSITTINLADGSKRQHEIDYDLKDSRIWLARHLRWALCNDSAVLAMPKTRTAEVFLGHSSDPGEIDCVANL